MVSLCMLALQICTETFGAAPDVVISSSGAQTVNFPCTWVWIASRIAVKGMLS